MLIGIGGVADSGKDTSASYISKTLNFYNYSTNIDWFAKPLKDIAKIFGFSEDQLYNQQLKQVLDKTWNITPREFLQILGTDLFRNNFRDDVWIKIMEKKILEKYNGSILIIPDVRFKNELELIKKYNGVSIYINSNKNTLNDKESNHISETQLNKNDFQYIVDNNIFNDNYENLYSQLDKIIKELI
jgi:hypothetical protein